MSSSAGSQRFAELLEFLVILRDIVDEHEMIHRGQEFRSFLALAFQRSKVAGPTITSF